MTEAQSRILRFIRDKKSIDGLAGAVGLPPAALGKEIAILQLGGYLSEDGMVTDKATRALEDRAP